MRLVLPLVVATSTFAAGPITDEALRLKVLSAIFPEMEIERIDRRIDSTIRLDIRPPLAFPDALALAPAYRVTGPPQDDRERCAARDLAGRTTSSARELRFQLFPWPGAFRGELLAVLQYRFTGAQTAGGCPSLAGLFRMAPSGGKWKIVDSFPFETSRHNHLEGLQFLRLTGDDDEELVVESDSGDGARFVSDLHILLLAHGRFQELLNVPSRLHINGKGDQWSQTLDAARTLTQSGQQFCFDKTVWAADHRRFLVPEVTHPCYPRGMGVR